MNKKEIVRSERITFVTTPDVRKLIENLAEKEGRSLSNTVEKIIQDAVKNAE